MEKVLLFKSPDNSKLYKEILEENGYTPLFLPVLEFVFVNLEELLIKLKNYNDYSGLIITSQRAVESLKKCLNGIESVIQNWNTKPIFAVGETTAKKICNDFNISVCDFQPGNANALGDYIIEQNKKKIFTKPLLFPCANIKSDVLPSKLKDANIKVDCIDVYNTQKHSEFEDSLHQMYKDENGIPFNLIFFSPSGVDFAVPVLKNLGYEFEKSKIVSIGPSTGKKLKELGFTQYAVADEPTPMAIFKCLGRLKKQSNEVGIN